MGPYFLNIQYDNAQESRNSHDDEALKKSINDYEDALARYIPVLMAQVSSCHLSELWHLWLWLYLRLWPLLKL